MIGFEPLEIYSILIENGHDDVRVVMNDRPLYPLDSLQKKSTYPELKDLFERINHLSKALKVIPASSLALEAGHPMTQNVVMVGAFAGLNWLPLGKENYLAPLEKIFSGEKLTVNQKAFRLGFNAGQETKKGSPFHETEP
jgi:indolepyruvate ferredoxin oxidoreductase beta subunit